MGMVERMGKRRARCVSRHTGAPFSHLVCRNLKPRDSSRPGLINIASICIIHSCSVPVNFQVSISFDAHGFDTWESRHC